MNKFQVKMFEAGSGDSFLVRCKGESTTNILVDFGYSNTYTKHIEKNLKNMAANNEKLDLVIVTHIDQDHISGGIRFFEYNGPADSPNIISVEEVWHNSYRHLEMAVTNKELSEKERKHIARKSIVVEKSREENITDTNGKHGSRLAANLYSKQYNWNSSFDGQAISYKDQGSIYLNDEVKITILSPTQKELENLREIWREELKDKFPTIELNNDIIFDDAVECVTLMRRPTNVQSKPTDTSSTTSLEDLASIIFKEDPDEVNASSITCIIEFKDKRILLLGDSIPSIIEAQIKKIYKNADLPIVFDAIKVSHHGSARNINNDLLEVIDSRHYFISTNGKTHGHPNIETIAKIIVRRKVDFIRNIHFTNKLSKLDIFDNKEWQQKYRYRTHYKDISEDSLDISL